MKETPLYINSILNYVVQEAESIDQEISNFFVKSKAFELLKEKVKRGIKFINLTGSGGTGKTANAIVLSKELEENQNISYLSFGEDIDLRKSRDILFIDNIEEISEKRLNRILNSKRIKQFVVISRNILNFEKINFEIVVIPNLNQAEIKNLIDKRLYKLDSQASSIVYDSILRNSEILKKEGSPRAILEFVNNTYREINKKVRDSNKGNISKDEKLNIPLSSVLGMLISIMLFLLTQRNSQISTNTIIEELNINQKQLIELFELGNHEDDLNLCYLVAQDLNIRKYPRKKDSQIIKIATKNSTIKVIEKRSKWWFVESINIEDNKNTNGWVYSDYLLPMK